MDGSEGTTCVILAGGAGKRMASAGVHKVCFPIAGRPAIVRAIDTYKAAGLRRFLVVVGQKAEQVIATVSQAHPEVSFVYQADPRGTGHAAMVAADALAAQGCSGETLIVMGDKMTRPRVVRDLLAKFRQGRAEVVLSTLAKSASPTAGRVVTDDAGKLLGIVEVADIQRARRTRRKLTVSGRKFSAAQIELRCQTVNASMYVFHFAALVESLAKLDAGNAQGELYLTDTIETISLAGRAEPMLVDDPEDLMAFNTPAELLAIEEVVRRREKAPRVSAAGSKRLTSRALKPAKQWLAAVDGDSRAWVRELGRTYGDDASLLGERRRAIRRLVKAFIKHHGADRKMILCRAPGRINLMGRHVDHRGGFVNVMAINREVLLAAGPREDDLVTLRNVQQRPYPPRSFRMFDLLSHASWTDWIDFVNSRVVTDILDGARGDWSHYARAPLLRLQHECRDVRLMGMDCVLSGDIPVGAGLSSSSALVVAFAEAAVALNRLNVAMGDFIDLCGEGEWFVGSRGGSADHAAIRTGRIEQVSRIGFYPFHMAGEVRFPRGLRLVVTHSGSKAVKSADARDIFNQRVACYELGQLLLRRSWPAAAGVERLRDLVPARLKVRSGDIYRALMRLPVRPSRGQLRRLLPKEDHDRLEAIFSTHADLGSYDIRGVVLYGLGELVRSEQFAEVVRSGDLERVGRFMRTSHDGDRVVRFAPDGKMRKHVVRTSDAALKRLAEREADLADQCGRYACSTEAIDDLVDTAHRTPGVVGAQLAGAGLGGCMMILVHQDRLAGLMSRLRSQFYRPRGLDFGAHVFNPVAGAGLLLA